MKQTYRVVAGLIALGVLVQAAAVAFGWFEVINELENGLVIDENFEGNAGHVRARHRGARRHPGYSAPILLIVSFFAAKSVPGRASGAGSCSA